MAAELFMVAVDWYGPSYSLTQARELGKDNQVEGCLYLAYEPAGQERSYVGITNAISNRLTTGHHIFGNWPEETFNLWLGIVKSQPEPGRRPSSSPKVHSEALHFAEALTTFFVETTLNQKKAYSPPKRSGVLFNRWYKLEPDWPRHKKRPHPRWPNLVECDLDERIGRNVYFGGHVETKAF